MKLVDRRKNIRKHRTKKPGYRPVSAIRGIAIHHSLTTDGSADAFADYHIGTNNWSVMGYNYVINRDGTVEFCADWTVITPHVGNHNKQYLGICLVGDFRKQKPTEEQLAALYELLEDIRSKLKLSVIQIVGHQELAGYSWKQCPAFSMDELRGHVQFKTYGQPKTNVHNDGIIGITRPVTAPHVPADTQRYRLLTGTFSTKEQQKAMAEKLRKATGWLVHEINQNGFRLQTGTFAGKLTAEKSFSTLQKYVKTVYLKEA